MCVSDCVMQNDGQKWENCWGYLCSLILCGFLKARY